MPELGSQKLADLAWRQANFGLEISLKNCEPRSMNRKLRIAQSIYHPNLCTAQTIAEKVYFCQIWLSNIAETIPSSRPHWSSVLSTLSLKEGHIGSPEDTAEKGSKHWNDHFTICTLYRDIPVKIKRWSLHISDRGMARGRSCNMS